MILRREDILRQIGASSEWDVVVIGGGATGLGVAVEAASRGHKTLLLEAHDFAKATSSRSTKLVHGGVRYLQQGNVKLVREALRERGRILQNAPHLAHRRAFVIPAYSFTDLALYSVGLRLYDFLAGRETLGHSRMLSPAGVCGALPTLCQTSLKGGILYYDGQFDDARFAIALLRTLFDLAAVDQSSVALNYARVTGFLKRGGRISGVVVDDTESGATFEAPAKIVINSTGVFADSIRQLDEPGASGIVTPSQGSHVVLPRSFLPGDAALIVPRTADGRVLFAIPWHDRVLVGTTDDPVPQPALDPRPMPDERQFLKSHIERFLNRSPQPSDILSVWSGQRPLVRHGDTRNTAALSRDHTILISPSNLITIVGGKWTTYRKMAEDTIDRAAPLARLPRVPSRTATLKLHGFAEQSADATGWRDVYGADLPALEALANEDAQLNDLLHPAFPFRQCEVVWAARYEMARRLEDVLARRTRALFLDAKASIEAAPLAARLMARELNRDEAWQRNQLTAYTKLAEQYIWSD